MKTKILVSSIITAVVCLCLIAGSTFALFTRSVTTNIVVSAGNVSLSADIDRDKLQASSYRSDNQVVWTEEGAKVMFANKGYAQFNDVTNNLEIVRMTPGDQVRFTIEVNDQSNIPVDYRIQMINKAKIPLDVTVEHDGTKLTLDSEGYSGWFNGTYDETYGTNTLKNFVVTVSFPTNAGNEHQDAEDQSLQFIVHAIQANHD